MTDLKTRVEMKIAADAYARFEPTDNGDDGAANYGYIIGANSLAPLLIEMAESLEYYQKYNYQNEPNDIRCVAMVSRDKLEDWLVSK